MEIDKEDVVQAVVIVDTFNNNFHPITKSKPMALLTIAGVPLVDYVLESLALGGVCETILFCCQDGVKIKEHIRKSVENKAPWSLKMEAQVLMSDSCQTMGDVMREIDAAGVVKGYFILTGIGTVTNAPLAAMLEQHKQLNKKNKGAAMTLVYKKVSWKHPLISSDKQLFLATDAKTSKVLEHNKYRPKSKDKTITLPLENVLSHSEIKFHHNLADPNIALCSPTVPPLFADNFDFQTRDDFIHGILINEEILASSLYYAVVKQNEYAAAVTNWKTYQTVCRDILHNWVHPLTFETGSFYQNNFMFLGNHNFKNKSSTLSRSCKLEENVLIGANTQISENTVITNSVIGSNCVIGNNATVRNSHLQNNVVIHNCCEVHNSFVDDNCVIEEGSVLKNGCIVSSGVTVKKGSQLDEVLIESQGHTGNTSTRSRSETTTDDWENDASESEEDEFIGFNKRWSDSDSNYSSEGSDVSSLEEMPVQEDTNIFLQEVIDSLARGYEEKLKCDYLIVEINSSRYAYNIQLNEVNFLVIRAMLSMPVLAEAKNVLSTVGDILKFFRPVLNNYIKGKSSIMDCLSAIEESCIKNEWLHGKAGHILHIFYEADVIDEDCLLEWYEELKENESDLVKQPSMVKFFEWLQEASEESESE